MIWYKNNLSEIYKILKTSEDGLTEEEAQNRLKKYGQNVLSLHKEPLWRVIIEPFKNIFIGVLALAALISILSNHVLDAVIISAIIIINAVIFYIQQYATGRVLRSLKKHNVQKIRVIRNGRRDTISSIDLVPGDVILLGEGERIPADARIMHVDDLQIDESSLTGESVPVHKHASTLSTDKQIYERDNMLFQGAYVLSGEGAALVVETGVRTEFGKIADLVAAEHEKSPVQEKIDRLVSVMIKVIALVAIIVFILALFRGITTAEALRFVLSLSVSAVPEGLPVALAVVLVLGMRQMAKRKALVRNFKSIEDIGLVTTIATDKTGTLTKNHLTVVSQWSLKGEGLKSIVAKAVDDDEGSDPLDLAIKEFLPDAGSKQNANKFYPFNIALRVSGSFVPEDKKIYIKGSPEHIIAQSKLDKESKHQAESALREFASQGYRVVGLASTPAKEAPKDLSNLGSKLDFAGFLAFADELRPEAAKAIADAHKANVKVKLITGDHFETAYNIGKRIGLAEHRDQVVQGSELPKDDDKLSDYVETKTVFARILPEDKFRILKALKKNEITAMTGDGVNDVPALSNAHVGIAMGSGSDIARDAGGIVLLNDNFATIINALSEGRKIFDNIRRMLFYLLSTSLGEVLTMIGALILGLPLPVVAIQILWINLVTDTAMVIPLGMEPAEDGHMKRPPRKPKTPLLGKVLLSRMFLIASTMAIITLVIVHILNSRGYEDMYIQTVAFMTLIVAQWANAFNARSEYSSFIDTLKHKNPGLLVGFTIGFILQMIVMFGPLQAAFYIQPVALLTLLISAVVMAVSIWVVSEIHKLFSRKYMKNDQG